MVFIAKLIIFVICCAVGIYLIINRRKMVYMFGKAEYAEKLSRGGSYPMWALIGAIVIILGFLTLIGSLDWLFKW